MPRILAAGFVLAAFITTLPLAVAAFTDRRALAAAFVIGLFIISSAAGGILTGCHEGREHQGDSECEAITGDAAKWLGLVDVSRVPTNINNMIFDDEDGDRRSRIVSGGAHRPVPRHDRRTWRGALAALPEVDGMSESQVPIQAPTINVQGVSKWFGSVVAVNDVSFQVRPGITGLLGPNGADKSTILHMITGKASASEGEVTVLGQAPRNNPEIYRDIGVMSEHEAVYGFYTGREFVEFTARLHGLDPIAAPVDRAIGLFGLEDAQH